MSFWKRYIRRICLDKVWNEVILEVVGREGEAVVDRVGNN
jgi:hypothetical protein